MENYTCPFIMATQPTNNRSVSPNHRHTNTILINLAQEISVIKHTMGEMAIQIKEFIRTWNHPCIHGSPHSRLIILANVTTITDSGQRKNAVQHPVHTTLETTRETNHPATCSCNKPWQCIQHRHQLSGHQTHTTEGHSNDT